jgi:antitoxin VapB
VGAALISTVVEITVEGRTHMPALNIKDPEVHELAVLLAHRTHQSLTNAVRNSLRESLSRHKVRQPDPERTVERVMRIAQRISSLPVLDPRTPEEILGYNDSGTFE